MSQHDLFASLNIDPLEQANAPELDLELDVIHYVNQCIRNSGLGRERFLDRINLCLRSAGKQVTLRQLNHWLSPSQANAIPAWVMPAICWAGQSIQPFNGLLNPLGYKAADRRASLMQKITESKLEAAAKTRESKELEKMMKRMLENNEDTEE
ncbi:hypothetical protein [Bowmanella dokdonensis]|uniref:Uncharacterized protein n=1 Tax=Bowmanella dokdonensis TaxID=751969 RepID=A0A939IM01_9ALTE|nr:hypothetical protein [Bowmanella dokdonensis]MBN7824758.1 hypothetical protein [Bowmanella dokdonensis]